MTAPASTPVVFSSPLCELGESPVWDERRGGLFWLDILGQSLFYQGADARLLEWRLPCVCSAIFLPQGNFPGVLMASEKGVASFDLDTRRFQVLAATGDEAPDMRTNDGGVDPAGWLWFGTMAKRGGSRPGAVYRWSASEGMKKVLQQVYIPNTFVWTDSGERMFTADSHRSSIRAFRFDRASGDIELISTLVDLTPEGVEPDGSAMDLDNGFWNAQWNGARLVRYTADGSASAQIPVPALRPTSCCFGGEDMRTLFITSAAGGLSDTQRAQYPHSGAVFSVRVETPGRKISRISGITASGDLDA